MRQDVAPGGQARPFAIILRDNAVAISTHTPWPEQRTHSSRGRLLHAMIVLGQVGAISAAGLWLGALPPAAVLGGVPALLAAAHLLSWRLAGRAGESRANPADGQLFAQLMIEVAVVAALLYFAGGATNPFVWLMLLSVTVAATMLGKLETWCVALEAVGLYTLLMRYYLPLPAVHLPMGSSFEAHVFGMWIGFLLSAFLIAYFVAGMTADVRLRDAALARAREQALRDEQLASLGLLAASAAHELGTPLGTLTVLAEEAALDLETGEAASAADKIERMRGQLERCEQALRAMASAAGAEGARGGRPVELASFLGDTVGAWRQRRPRVSVRYSISDRAPPVRLVAEQSLTSALTNLFDNAADESPDDVEISADWSDEALAVRVEDRGHGFAPGLEARVGKAPFTGKPRGHGLGLYLSKRIIDRLGGELRIAPRRGGGTTVEVVLPLEALRL